MEKKINIAQLLKDCPTGMELDCVMYENVYFDKINDDKKSCYPILCYITDEKGNRSSISFTKNGCESIRYGAKCVIFPKGKTTWEGFQRPFKDGDVVVAEDDELYQLFLLKYLTHSEDDNDYDGYCYFGWDFQSNKLFEKGKWGFNRLATEEEKQKLFQAIKDNGYKWNEETKLLENLIEPKFKVGDVIQDEDGYKVKITEVNLEDECYEYESIIAKGIGGIGFIEQDDYELVPNKFDITSLKPFDKVLVRDSNKGSWNIHFFSYIDCSKMFKTIMGTYIQCIPYKGNEHLLGKTDDCDEFYKTWE